MDNNLIPPFIMREAGIHVNEVPKIHAAVPTVDHHSIYFTEQDFRIPLQLWGTFSFFQTSRPSIDFADNCEHVYTLTPQGKWSPHSDVYARNEEAMLDWEGHMIPSNLRHTVLLDDIPDS